MADNSRGGWPGGLRRRGRFVSSARTNRPLHFFKIILPSSIRDEKLMMPKRFVRMVGHELSPTASLTVPNGGVWQVGLEKANGQIWFSDGWSQFVDCHSIGYCYLLVFRYEGNSSFQVLIFDTTASEIQYPHDDLQDEELGCGEGIEFSDSVISIPSFNGYSDPKFGHGSLGQIRTSKTICNPKSEENLSDSSQESSDVETQKENKRKQKVHGYGTGSKKCKVEDYIKIEDSDVLNDPRQKLHSSTRTATSDECKMAIHAAERFKTRNPSFTVILKKPNIQKFYAYVPSSFSTKYLSREEEIIEIQAGSNGQKWQVRCFSSGSSTKRLGRGWGVFSRENNLKAGDVIVFELVKSSSSNNRVLKFTVFPAR